MKTLKTLLLALALAGGALIAEENPQARRLELRDVPLAEAIRRVEEATGRKIEAPESAAGGRTVTFVARGTPGELLAAFGATLEKTQELTLVPGRDGALRLHRFVPAKAVAPRLAPRGRRLTVTVVEGSVALVGDRGRVTVRAGEKSSVAAGSLPTEPRACDTSAVAAWRLRDAAPAGGLEAQVPLPSLKLRLVGYTEDGRPIVEYEVEGSRQQVVVGELETSGIDRNKLVIEGDELVLPLNIRLKLDRGNK